jgi:periplasmic protein TonB
LGTYRLRTAQEQQPLRRRASGFALALAVNAALLLALLTLGVIQLPEQQPSTATIVDLMPESHDRSAARPAKAAQAKPRQVATPVRPRPHPPIKSPIPPPHPLPWLELSSRELAAADLKNVPRAGDGDGSSGDSEEVGRGPHGEILYAAEWARKPTNAELGGYLPAGAPEGSGLIACKTVPGNRVDDCVELGNDPPGSHLARAVRLAAWQFRVRPPRKNGRPMIGEWVRIRIDYYTLRGE